MNLKEAQKKIVEDEMPASEAARLLDQVRECGCIHFRHGECQQIEFCVASEVIDPGV